jgi:phosphohistidine phosphatase
MKVELFLVRHAVAEEKAAGKADESRALTDEGRKEFKAVVRALKEAKVRLDRIFHSPLLRAVETADLLTKVLDGETTVLPGLAEAPDADLLAAVKGRRPALVGHEPWMSTLLAWLVTGKPDLADRFEFPKGGVARLAGEVAPGRMVLTGLWSPDLLARLGR